MAGAFSAPTFDEYAFDVDYTSSAALFVSVAGVQRATGRLDTTGRILHGSLSVVDILNETPNTCRFQVMGFTPTVGQRVLVSLGGASNPSRLFAGTILSVQQSHVGAPDNAVYDVECADDTWKLGLIRVTTRYTATSATDIAEDLIATYAPDFTADVEAALPTVDEITFTNEPLGVCLTRLAKRIGGYWKPGEFGEIHFFITDTGVNPSELNDSNGDLLNVFAIDRDISQMVTRVLGEGGGSTALADVAVGETLVPVASVEYFNVAGGQFVSGPQRCTYTGIETGGGGGLVGTGAAPSAAPSGTLADGSGVTTGDHLYAYTFVTGSGETIAGPTLPLTVGYVSAPSGGPTAGSPTVGSGVTTGNHYYAVTFVTSAGETTSSPISGTVSPGPITGGAIADPGGALSAAAPTSGGSVTPGAHNYAYTFYNGAGETLPSATAARTVPEFSAPSSGPNHSSSGSVTGNLVADVSLGYRYAVTYTTSAGETTETISGFASQIPFLNYSGGGSFGPATAGGSVDDGDHDYAYTYSTASGETTVVGSTSGVTAGGGNNTVPATRPLFSDARITHWNIYRTKVGGSTYFLVASVAAGTASYNDTASDASLSATQPPSVDTSSTGQMSLTGIPTGPTGTTGRKIYRTTLGGSTYKLLTTISNNSTTTYTDNTADGSLGAAPPASNTATFEKTVALTSISTGPSGTTGRKVYRTVAGGTQLKLLATIANNTSTTYSDTTADGSLGANVPTTNTTATTTNYNVVPLTGIPTGPANVTSRKVYRTAAGGSQLKFVATIANNTATTYSDTMADGSLGANIPVTNTAAANQVSLTGIAVGPSGTTQRKVYRTVAAGSQLKLVTTLADNTTTIYTDATADGSLGANVPSSDTSGLSQGAGQVLAGATTIPVASTGTMPVAGWAVIGNGQQVIRYTGKTTISLTGVPASGAGAITASVSYNSNITAAPMLTGVPASSTGSILFSMVKGDPVNLFIIEDDVAAQAVLAAAVGDGDGVVEEVVQDRRLTEAEIRARAVAVLALRAQVAASITYAARGDRNTRSGRTIAVNLTAYSLTESFKIQKVTIGNFQPDMEPVFSVEASTSRFSFEDLLRLARGGAV